MPHPNPKMGAAIGKLKKRVAVLEKELSETINVAHLTPSQVIQVKNFVNRLPKEGDDE